VPTYIALLRGVNVGGRKLPMAELRAALTEAGGTDVVSYIQSGNVVFSHRARSAAKARAFVEETIASTFGMDVWVAIRTADQLDAVVATCPFEDDDPTKVHVTFFTGSAPDPATWMDLASFAPEEAAVVGDEMYLHLPLGMGQSKLVEQMGKGAGRKPMADGTSRNWRTVLKLVELAKDR
jgi:uncharacterized protein (DUF1697 family)